jgi:hypothetical protein
LFLPIQAPFSSLRHFPFPPPPSPPKAPSSSEPVLIVMFCFSVISRMAGQTHILPPSVVQGKGTSPEIGFSIISPHFLVAAATPYLPEAGNKNKPSRYRWLELISKPQTASHSLPIFGKNVLLLHFLLSNFIILYAHTIS